MVVTNKEFLAAIFGDEMDKAHVTSFPDDPSDISPDRRARCWGGGSAKARTLRVMKEEDNQYFTISLFKTDDEGVARRRKGLFDACFVIVADDVAEKIPEENAEKLPAPSYKLLTSAGSEQWGWILEEPEEDRSRVENLLDGLVAQGLVPDGTDTGMKGVTRYVRLPEGSNTKAKRLVEGKPFKCQMLSWEPGLMYSMEALASVFDIDLSVARVESNSVVLCEGNPVFDNHPLLKHVAVTGVNNDWLQIDCPNAGNHTGDDKSGAAVIIREDGSVGFKCHHGNCEDLTAVGVVDMLGITDEVNAYIHQIQVEGNKALAELSRKELAEHEATGGGDRSNEIIQRDDSKLNLLRYIYVWPINKIYDVCTGYMMSDASMRNMYLREYDGSKNIGYADVHFHKAKDEGLCLADAVGWMPWDIYPPKRSEMIMSHGAQRLVNTWPGLTCRPVLGDSCKLWLDHIEYLIPDAHQREVVLDYFAFTFQKLNEKPAFTILHRGYQGNGKDLMLKPIASAFGPASSGSVKIDQLTDSWGDYIAKKKFLIIEEVSKAQNRAVNNALKTLLAPDATGSKTLNLKGGSVVTQVDCVATYMMSNKRNPLTLEEGDRRYFVVDSWVEAREPSWYSAIDNWLMNEGGVAKVLGMLLTRDISRFNARVLPSRTEGYQDMIDSGRYDYEITIEEMCNGNKPPFNLPLFELTTLKAEAKKHDVKAKVSSLIEATEACGWVLQRGTKKIKGVVKNTPKHFVKKEEELDSVGAIFDRYQSYLGVQN